MNTLNFNQSIGFRFETEILDEMQKAYTVFNFLGDIVGNMTIISGCTVTGSTVSDGCVYINGEVLPFRAGVVQPTVVIKQEIEPREFEDGNTHDVIFRRYVAFGVAPSNQYNWSDFKRGLKTKDIQGLLDLKVDSTQLAAITNRLTELEKKTAPFSAGKTYLLWNRPASEIPAGWVEAEEMRGFFPVGYKPGDSDFQTVGGTGGSKTKQLTITELPPHNHSSGFAYAGHVLPSGGTGQHIEQGSTPTSTVGEGKSFSILNPYRIVIFIKYVG